MKGDGRYVRPALNLIVCALCTALVIVAPASYAVAGSSAGVPANSNQLDNTTEVSTAGQLSSGYQSSQSKWEGDPAVSYENNAESPLSAPGVGSIHDFMIEGEDNMSPLGFEVREDRRKLKSGQEASGLVVTEVVPGGPAARAGLKAYSHPVKRAIEAVSVIASVVVPLAAPAMMLVPIMESSHVGENYDLIIGIDGFRVSNIMDFEDRMRDVQPGEIVYLSLIRDGRRMQLPVQVPGASPPPIS